MVGFTFLALLVMLLVLNVSVVFLARRDLVSAADAAAVAAAQGIDMAVYRERGAVEGALLLDEDAAADLAEQFEDRDVDVKNVTVEGATVTVVVQRDVALPFGGLFGLHSWHVEAEASARTTLR